uniref:GPI-anchor transamidase n=1 Tax=Heterosigma akashiwo TaxID=2829 RepID=A0A7S3XWF2_HETAK
MTLVIPSSLFVLAFSPNICHMLAGFVPLPDQADNMPCNARNPRPGEIYNDRSRALNLYGAGVEVDYRGDEVTVENFLRLLTGHHPAGTPPSKRLATGARSNLLVFLSGHGGDGFLKFQDHEEISSEDIADAFEEMNIKERYNEILFITDTCQAGSLADRITSPRILALGSSKVGQNSYSHHGSLEIGAGVIDRFTRTTLDFFEQNFDEHGKSDRFISMQELLSTYTFKKLKSDVDVKEFDFPRKLSEVPVTDFFGSVLDIELTDDTYPVVI